MKLPKKSNKVSWAIGANLHQDDCPSEIHCRDSEAIAPGFDATCNSNACKDEQPSPSSSIPLMVHWNGPPKFTLDSNWRVAAGEESKEVVEQTCREMGVPEANYPCLSAIPSDPCVSFMVEEEQHGDSLTPIIPVHPRDEEEASPPVAAPNQPRPQHSPPVGPDYMTAASAAVTAIVKIQQSGSLIDTDLLVKIFSDPNIFKKLMSNNSSPVPPDNKPSPGLSLPSMGQPRPPTTWASSDSSRSSWVPSKLTVLSSPIPSSPPGGTAKPARTSTFSDIIHVKNLIKEHGSVPDSSLDYVKHLIKEHGSGEAKMMNPGGVPNVRQARDAKQDEADPKCQKPCTFFKTPRGCRNGAGCPFLHDSPFRWERNHMLSGTLPAAKRSKLRAGIASSRDRIELF